MYLNFGLKYLEAYQYTSKAKKCVFTRPNLSNRPHIFSTFSYIIWEQSKTKTRDYHGHKIYKKHNLRRANQQ